MIKLEVEERCHKCPYFEADCKSAYGGRFRNKGESPIVIHVITCSHREFCKEIVDRYEHEKSLKEAILKDSGVDRCVVCGKPVPEGKQVCPNCALEV